MIRCRFAETRQSGRSPVGRDLIRSSTSPPSRIPGTVVDHHPTRGPDAAVRVEADPVRADTLRPDPPVRHCAVGCRGDGAESWALVALDCAVDTSTPAADATAHVLATFGQF